jgi:hypothetical protein
MALNLCKPTSVTTGGGSATISTNGSVRFAGASSVSLNGVFKSDFQFYKILFRTEAITSAGSIVASLRKSGTDNTSSYLSQIANINGTSLSTFNTTAYNGAFINNCYGTWAGAAEIDVFSPFISKPTTFIVRNVSDQNYASLYEGGTRHGVTDTFDGITFAKGTSMTGWVAVYGLSQ